MYSPLRPILLVTGFYLSSTFLFSIGAFVDGGLSTEPVCLTGWLFFIDWLEIGGLATELGFVVVFFAKKVETGSYVELYYF